MKTSTEEFIQCAMEVAEDGISNAHVIEEICACRQLHHATEDQKLNHNHLNHNEKE